MPAALVTRGIAFWTGIAVLTALVFLQYGTTWLAVRSGRFEQWVTNPPRVLYRAGSFDERNLQAERVTRRQLTSKLREQGYASLRGIDAIVMETSGRVAVLRVTDGAAELLEGILEDGDST